MKFSLPSVSALLTLSLLVSPIAHAVDNVADEKLIQQLLSDMPRAFRSLDYQGVFTLEQGGQMMSSRIFHKVEAGKQFERLVSVDGPERELVRSGTTADCLQPADIILQGLLPQGLLKEIGRLGDHYRFLLGDEIRIANRQAHFVTIEPKDEYRYGYTLAIDKETGLLLQSRMVAGDDQQLDRFQFVTIDFGEIDPSLLEPVSANHEQLPAQECNESGIQPVVDDSPWQLDLPAGYMFCHFEKHEASSADALMFSDGLSSFSVFINPGKEAGQSYFKGSTLLYSQQAQVDGESFTVTVVGEVPESTAMRVASGLTRKGQRQ